MTSQHTTMKNYTHAYDVCNQLRSYSVQYTVFLFNYQNVRVHPVFFFFFLNKPPPPEISPLPPPPPLPTPADPTPSRRGAATPPPGAGPGPAAATPPRSSGIATAMTPATVSAAASRTNVTISGSDPLPAARCQQAPGRCARAPCATTRTRRPTATPPVPATATRSSAQTAAGNASNRPNA